MPIAASVRLALPLAGADLVEADGVDRLAQGLGVVAGVEVALGDVVERHLLGADQAFHAQVVGLDAELARERLERHLEREAHAGASDAAVGQDRRLVGGDRVDLAAVVGKIVEAGQDRADLAALQAGREGIGGVGAGIDGCLAVERQQATIGIGVGCQNVMVLAAVGVGSEAFAAILQPAQGCAELAGRPRQRDLLGQKYSFVAEATADIGGDDPDLALAQPQTFREPGAHDVRLLGGGVDDELTEARVPLGDDAAALEGAHGLTGGAQLARHRHGGLGLDRLEIHIRGAGEVEVVAPVLVDERRAGTTRGQHVGNDGQRLEVDFDFGGHVLCLGARGRGTERDQLADVAYLAGGQDRLHGRLEAG